MAVELIFGYMHWKAFARNIVKCDFCELFFKDCDEAVKQSIPKFGSPMSTNHFLDLL